MQPENKQEQIVDINSFSLNDLKALAYDRIRIIEQAQIDLRTIQEVINKKEKEKS